MVVREAITGRTALRGHVASVFVLLSDGVIQTYADKVEGIACLSTSHGGLNEVCSDWSAQVIGCPWPLERWPSRLCGPF